MNDEDDTDVTGCLVIGIGLGVPTLLILLACTTRFGDWLVHL